jgi:hypothetical protein
VKTRSDVGGCLPSDSRGSPRECRRKPNHASRGYRVMGVNVDDPVAEATAPGVASIRGASLDQRSLPLARIMEEQQKVIVQNDCTAADPPPPRALLDLYKVKAQMLARLDARQEARRLDLSPLQPFAASVESRRCCGIRECCERGSRSVGGNRLSRTNGGSA